MDFERCNELRLEAYAEVARLEAEVDYLERESKHWRSKYSRARGEATTLRKVMERQEAKFKSEMRELRERLNHAVRELAKPKRRR